VQPAVRIDRDFAVFVRADVRARFRNRFDVRKERGDAHADVLVQSVQLNFRAVFFERDEYYKGTSFGAVAAPSLLWSGARSSLCLFL